MASKLLEASAVVFLVFASFVALSAFGKAPAPAQYHPAAEIYPQGSGSGLDADTLDAKHASAFITSETDPTVAASVKDGVSWGEVSGRPSYSCGAANQGLKTIDLNTGAVSCETDDIGGGISGSGSANYVAKWASGTSLGNSIIYDNGNVGVGTASPGQKLSVAGTIESTSGGIKFPDGSVQTTAAGGGAQWVWDQCDSGCIGCASTASCTATVTCPVGKHVLKCVNQMAQSVGYYYTSDCNAAGFSSPSTFNDDPSCSSMTFGNPNPPNSYAHTFSVGRWFPCNPGNGRMHGWIGALCN